MSTLAMGILLLTVTVSFLVGYECGYLQRDSECNCRNGKDES